MLDRPVSSTHRQLRELTAWGALERDERGRYRIGLRLWEVGSLAPRSTDLRLVALPFLQDLYEVTHENVQLAVLDGNDVVYIDRVFSHRATRIIAAPGVRLPSLVTGVGRVLVAHAEQHVVNGVLAAPVPRLTPYTVVDPTELRRELAKVRRAGYAITDRQVEVVSSSVAAPIRAPGASEVVAALSVIVPVRAKAARRFVPAVLTAALGISRALGPAGGLTRISGA
jgi:DNA-binding IclR family transcriptional regulator